LKPHSFFLIIVCFVASASAKPAKASPALEQLVEAFSATWGKPSGDVNGCPKKLKISKNKAGEMDLTIYRNKKNITLPFSFHSRKTGEFSNSVKPNPKDKTPIEKAFTMLSQIQSKKPLPSKR